jgi:polyisoprenoid-binding protein YceI
MTENLPAPPAGDWTVDPEGSHARFTAATLGGLAKTPGYFRELSGSLMIADGHAQGVLAINTASVDTGNRLRDRHLRGADFFGVAKHPELRYELHALTPAGQAKLRLDGQLAIAGRQIALPLNVDLDIYTDALLQISARTHLDRVALGLRGARGMVPRAVELDIRVTLRRNGG